MKRFILGFLLAVSSIGIFAQGTKPTQFHLNATTHGDVRGIINNAFDAVYDTFYVQRALFTGYISALDIRLDAVEAAPNVDLIGITGVPVTYQIPYFSDDDTTLSPSTLYWRNTNLGITVTNPVYKIHADGGNATASYLGFTAGTTTGLTITDGFKIGIDGTGKGWLHQNEAHDIGVYAYGAEKLVFTSTGTEISDVVRLVNLVPANTYGYLYIDQATQTLAVDSSYNNSSGALTVKLPKTKDLLGATNSDGEIMWPFSKKDGRVEWFYRTADLQLGQMLTADQGMIEVCLRKIAVLEQEKEDLSDRLSTESDYRESLEKRYNQLEKDVSVMKHKISKRELKIAKESNQ